MFVVPWATCEGRVGNTAGATLRNRIVVGRMEWWAVFGT